MVEKDLVFKGKIKNFGPFDWKEFYRFCYTWLVDKEYWVVEKEYTEKITATGKEIEVHWEAKRKISDYFRFFLKVDWRILGMKKVEVEIEGKKIELDKGQVECNVTAILEKDYEQRWETNPLMKFFRSIYDRYIIRARVEDYENRVYEEGDEFLAQAKAFLALEGKH